MKLSDLLKKTRVITVEFGSESVNVEYLVHAITPAFLKDNPDVIEQVKRVVVSWDVLDDEGNPLPPAEIAEQLPVAFLGAVITAIIDDMRLGDAEKKD
jgi:phosphoribosylaminoimidazole carboxylase (NCAIR synthetase)